VIRIQALGGLTVRGVDGKPIVGAATQPRRLAILALLARAGERGVSRERILTLLWPDADDERGPRALAQALYALRKDLSDEDLIVGAKELRFDPALVSADVVEFSSAVSRGDDAAAAALYAGPFLDGFHLPGADEFSRWAERERATLAHDYLRSVESLARAALIRGEPVESVTWWRKISALDPLNARFTMGLMDALFAAGDRAGAIQQARVYQLLVEQELDLPPDREVMALAERLRAASVEIALPRIEERRAPELQPTAPATIPVGDAGIPTREEIPASSAVVVNRPNTTRYAHATVALIAVAVVVVALQWARSSSRNTNRPDGVTQTGNAASAPVLVVGQIASYGTDSTAKALAGPVSDLLATSLARAPGLRVVSRGRLLELMRPASGVAVADTSAGGFVNAARRAGGTEIVEGTVYTLSSGKLRLDLRRVDLATGAIGDVHTVEGNDLFALVDSGTARLVAALGARDPSGSVADVTTRSATAYRMYEQGIRAYFRGDIRTAHAFFTSATGEDSLFALATYQSAITSDAEPESVSVRLARAKRLAARAPDRERLTILAKWAYSVSSPILRQVAETLVTRYPTEVEGYLYTGIARVYAGDFLGGVSPLERVVAMDSVSARHARPSCPSCEALRWLVTAYQLADSFPAAEREGRRWARLEPGAAGAGFALAEVFEAEGRSAQADSAFRTTAPSDPTYDDVIPFRAMHLIRAGAHDSADRLLIAKTKESAPRLQSEAYWLLAISLREQGRLQEALDAARRFRRLAVVMNPNALDLPNAMEAQLQLDEQHYLPAAALFDSIAHQAERGPTSSQSARGSAWMLTQVANARAAAGDTAAVARLADSIRVLGGGSGYGRDQRLFHHVRGLLLAARHDDAGAIAEFQSAIYSASGGYTRTNYELARIFLRDNRPRDAVAILQPALRGSLDASNLYVSRIELHERLAQAWEAAGGKDSAAAHYSIVARVWSAGDPLFRARADSARRRLVSLVGVARDAPSVRSAASSLTRARGPIDISQIIDTFHP
jgi:DNA-binding SARP family transcriptional activator/TolB-like protein